MSTQFSVGDKFRIIHYEDDQYLDLEILSREDKWATVLLGDKQMQVRLYKVTNPFSESILYLTENPRSLDRGMSIYNPYYIKQNSLQKKNNLLYLTLSGDE